MPFTATEFVNLGAPGISHIELNKLGTQYAQAVADAQADVDARSVLTQHSITGGGNLSADRTLNLVNDEATPGNSKYYGTSGAGAKGWHTLPTAETVPAGLILMWAGTLANIPSGYVLCDGNNSTPNLLARFVQGVATAATNPGATGGATSKTTAGHTHTQGATGSNGSHSHSVSTDSAGSHSHTVDSHYHSISSTVVENGSSYSVGAHGTTGTASPGTNSAGSHNHGGDTDTDGSHTHTNPTTASNTDSITDIRPLYYEIAFVMKT
ncbi:MAG: hypothetical protein P3T54_00240 [Dehalogenimonas sp.]|nr:hypothetical protein [Dehalogenimonas sp.]